ncbi:hypothetical protein M514_01920 [Trichuris suis]|uniref:Uncharacterized protein n=1 Tax=Trichuris suis TaxID=68888 RepID=A0A085NJA7_9BILA|nr:hypothetical protein M513_01920 [Trichuris suis]KFD69553.1 hypothetical protein M514_01920 [Trichuris suis]
MDEVGTVGNKKGKRPSTKKEQEQQLPRTGNGFVKSFYHGPGIHRAPQLSTIMPVRFEQRQRRLAESVCSRPISPTR